MSDSLSHLKFPDDSANRDYDVFEEFADGTTVWRACVFGIASAERKLRELARESNNNFFAINLQDQNQYVIRRHSEIRPSAPLAQQVARRVS